MGITDTSRFISLILRHKPETIGITLDEHGWANVKDLIEGIKKTRPFDMDMLEEIVRTDNKQRYSFNEDKTLIRANQGHSIPVDVELKKQCHRIFYITEQEKSMYLLLIKKGCFLRAGYMYIYLRMRTLR